MIEYEELEIRLKSSQKVDGEWSYIAYQNSIIINIVVLNFYYVYSKAIYANKVSLSFSLPSKKQEVGLSVMSSLCSFFFSEHRKVVYIHPGMSKSISWKAML